MTAIAAVFWLLRLLAYRQGLPSMKHTMQVAAGSQRIIVMLQRFSQLQALPLLSTANALPQLQCTF